MTLSAILLSGLLILGALLLGWLFRGLAEGRAAAAREAAHAAEQAGREARFAAERATLEAGFASERASLEAAFAAERATIRAGLANRETEHAASQAVAAENIRRLSEKVAALESVSKAREDAPTQVAGAMEPVKVALQKLEESLQRSDRHRAASSAELAEQLKSVVTLTTTSSDGLRRETARLAGALSHSDVRGKWGEFQLRQLLLSSGLMPGCHYTEQVQVTTDDGTLRPDVVIHLGAGKDVVVDAKVSLRSILEARGEDSDLAMQAVRKAHAREVRNHVDRLAAKEYAQQFDTAPEAVVMFLPAESLLSDAILGDPGLVEHAFGRGIILATPTSMMLLLRTVAHIWRQDEMAANARQVQALGRELADRMRTMLNHLDRVGSTLTSGVKAYNATIASMETRVLVTGRKFTELQGLPELPAPKQIELTPRNVVVPLPGPGPSAPVPQIATAGPAQLEAAAV